MYVHPCHPRVVNKLNLILTQRLTARKLPATGPVKAEVVPKAQKAVATTLPLTIMLVSIALGSGCDHLKCMNECRTFECVST